MGSMARGGWGARRRLPGAVIGSFYVNEILDAKPHGKEVFHAQRLHFSL